jgi:hypothetical protein
VFPARDWKPFFKHWGDKHLELLLKNAKGDR